MSDIYSECKIIYDGITSELYDLTILKINNTSWEHNSGSGLEIISESIDRNPSSLFIDAKYSKPLEFQMELICGHQMEVFEINAIKAWLFNTNEYKPLQICREDLKPYYFNCKLIPDKDYAINGYNGFLFTVVCDSPWAYSFPIPHKYDLLAQDTQIITINNFSTEGENIRPYIEFTTILNSGYFCITNLSNNNHKYEWNGLMNNETISCDWTEQVYSSTGLERSGCLKKDRNHGYFELVSGVNKLEVTACKNLLIEYKNAIRLGGG